MKRVTIFLCVVLLMSMFSCQQTGSPNQGETAQDTVDTVATFPHADKVFQAFATHFSETAFFAYARVSNRKVLLVSQETFGNNLNADREAIEATIFALDPKGKIVSLGSIRSQGTLYPVSILDGKLMVAGHQFVRIYSIRGDVPELVLDSYGQGEGPELSQLFETFEKGSSVKFQQELK